MLKTKKTAYIFSWISDITNKKNNLSVKNPFLDLLNNQLLKKIDLPFSVFDLSQKDNEHTTNLLRSNIDEFYILPLFPQFSYALTGKIAQYFSKLPKSTVQKIRIIKSYPNNPFLIKMMQETVNVFLQKQSLQQEDCIFMFVGYGIENTWIEKQDLFTSECFITAKSILKAFPSALGSLSYHSLEKKAISSTLEQKLSSLDTWQSKRKNVIIIPISLLFEVPNWQKDIEKQIFSTLRKKGFFPYYCPYIGLNPDWVKQLESLIQEKNFVSTTMLCVK